mmetsp:Transcript_27154/g.77083  ORF Transcript_27154/g.77083 Transcript_27154/m.77083 type:complete len:527 (+) Transcript_27154:1340-2920(+)
MRLWPSKKGPPTAMPIKFPVDIAEYACIQTFSDFTSHSVISRRMMVCAPSKVVKCGSPKVAQRPGFTVVIEVPVPGGANGVDGMRGVLSHGWLQHAVTWESTELCNASTACFRRKTSWVSARRASSSSGSSSGAGSSGAGVGVGAGVAVLAVPSSGVASGCRTGPSAVSATGVRCARLNSPDFVWMSTTPASRPALLCRGGAAAAAQEPPIVTVQRTARAFFWQSPGGVTPYFVALALLRLPHKPGITSVQFRLLLALGALPAMVVSLASIREMRQMKAAHTTVEAPPPAGGLQSALTDARHWKSLIGTAGTWALFDVAYYGTVIFTPMILSQVFGPKQTLTSLSIRSALVGAVGILGVSTGIFLLPRLGAKALSTIGLAISGVLFLALMVLFQFRSGWSGALFGLLCALVFVLQAAPNVATFVLPVLAFPPEVRSTFHGLSSASAKVGAMVGSFVFPVINDHGGVAAVMGTQAAICFAAALLSHCCLKSDVDHLALCHDDEENSNLSETASGSSSVSSLVDESPE